VNLHSKRALRSWRGFKIFRMFWLIMAVGICCLNIYGDAFSGRSFNRDYIWIALILPPFWLVFSFSCFSILRMVDRLLLARERGS